MVADQLDEHVDEQVVLGGEVLVGGRRRHARRGGDRADGHAVVPVGGGQGPGRIEELAAGRGLGGRERAGDDGGFGARSCRLPPDAGHRQSARGWRSRARRAWAMAASGSKPSGKISRGMQRQGPVEGADVPLGRVGAAVHGPGVAGGVDVGQAGGGEGGDRAAGPTAVVAVLLDRDSPAAWPRAWRRARGWPGRRTGSSRRRSPRPSRPAWSPPPSPSAPPPAGRGAAARPGRGRGRTRPRRWARPSRRPRGLRPCPTDGGWNRLSTSRETTRPSAPTWSGQPGHHRAGARADVTALPARAAPAAPGWPGWSGSMTRARVSRRSCSSRTCSSSVVDPVRLRLAHPASASHV